MAPGLKVVPQIQGKRLTGFGRDRIARMASDCPAGRVVCRRERVYRPSVGAERVSGCPDSSVVRRFIAGCRVMSDESMNPRAGNGARWRRHLPGASALTPLCGGLKQRSQLLASRSSVGACLAPSRSSCSVVSKPRGLPAWPSQPCRPDGDRRSAVHKPDSSSSPTPSAEAVSQ